MKIKLYGFQLIGNSRFVVYALVVQNNACPNGVTIFCKNVCHSTTCSNFLLGLD